MTPATKSAKEVWWKRWLLRGAAFAILPLLVQPRGRLPTVAEAFSREMLCGALRAVVPVPFL